METCLNLTNLQLNVVFSRKSELSFLNSALVLNKIKLTKIVQ